LVVGTQSSFSRKKRFVKSKGGVTHVLVYLLPGPGALSRGPPEGLSFLRNKDDGGKIRGKSLIAEEPTRVKGSYASSGKSAVFSLQSSAGEPCVDKSWPWVGLKPPQRKVVPGPWAGGGLWGEGRGFPKEEGI